MVTLSYAPPRGKQPWQHKIGFRPAAAMQDLDRPHRRDKDGIEMNRTILDDVPLRSLGGDHDVGP